MPPPRDVEEPLDLRHYFDILWRRKWIIIACVVIVTGVAVALSVRETPMYRATTELLLQGNDAEQRLGGAQVNIGVDGNRVQTEIGVVESDLVRRAVTEELGFRPDVDVSAKGETDIIELSATSPEPETAARIANTYAEVYVRWRRERTIEDLLAAQQTVQAEINSLQEQLAGLQQPIEELETELFLAGSEQERELIRSRMAELEAESQAERSSLENTLALYRSEMSSLQVSERITRTGGAQIISQANVPADPYSPQPVQSGFFGVAVGLMLGVGFAFLRETLDERVRSREEMERITGWPTIGLIPVIAQAKGGEHDLATIERPKSPSAEAFRALRTSVQFVGLERPLEVIQVTSPQSGDGKTATAANLAVALAQAGQRVVLLDADLRKPRIHDEFWLPNDIGFTTMLLDATRRGEAFHPTSVEGLVVVPSGPPPPNPSELLSLQSTRDVIDRIREECDILVIDSPPVLPVTDPLVLSNYVDGVLVVTNARSARSRELSRVRELLEQANANVIGISVNRVEADSGYGYGYRYRYVYGYGGTHEDEDEDEAGDAGGKHRRDESRPRVADNGRRRSRLFQR